MATILPYVYVGAACAFLGALFGVLWGRKHPKQADQLAAAANQAKANL